MPIGPVEIVVIGFHHGRFEGKIVAAIEDLVNAGTIRVLDATFIQVDDDGDADVYEIAEVDGLGQLDALVDHDDTPDLLTDDDIDAFLQLMAPGDAAAIICFEHAWLGPLRVAVEEAGGEVLDSIRIPAAVVEEVAALAAAEDGS